MILISSLPCICGAANDIDTQLKIAMKAYQVPVVGYAIIDNYTITSAQTISINPKLSVSNNTLFQAASISKSMTAYAALFLADHHRLGLDSPAINYLKHWKIPPSQHTKNKPVLIKNLMDMTSGLSVSGFAGYTKDQALPSAIDLLNGKDPANNARIEVTSTPGRHYFYSGGAFQVLQQVITDVSNEDFSNFMNKTILKKIGMHNSLYQYPLINTQLRKRVVPAFKGWSGQQVDGGWKRYACAGAGGMWSTPSDLAKFALNITASYLGKKPGLISKNIARQMLTRQKNTDFGLGVVVSGSGDNLYFWKAGHNYGYHSLLIMFPNQGKGVAIMTNSETGNIVIDYLVALIARKQAWPYYFPFFDELINIPNTVK